MFFVPLQLQEEGNGSPGTVEKGTTCHTEKKNGENTISHQERVSF